MNNDVKENLSQQSTWKRGLYMVLFAAFHSVANFLFFAIVVFQFLLKLFTGETNARLRKLGQSLATYLYQILSFLSFNSEYHPYPFGAWPTGQPRPSKITSE